MHYQYLKRTWLVAGVCGLLVALVWVVFGQAREFGFVNYDDPANVSANAHVLAGLSPQGIAWAFTHGQVGRWAPLTAISHMMDSSCFGPWPGGRHITNVLLHAACAVLLFLALMELTGALWRSAFVAAVFAIHPLRAEAVMWISARGELLGGFFFMLTLLIYARYAKRTASRVWYWSMIACFAMGLLCKPTLIMLPCVLLLLDYWPLGRFAKENPRVLLFEKIPLFALAIASCIAAALAQQSAETPIENLSLFSRIGNALVSCVVYLWQMIYPVGLAVFYPHPKGDLAWGEVIAALAVLGAITVAVYVGRNRFRYVVAGWGWYLVMLLPVLGIVETGAQAHADRYTYLPQIGIYLIVAWGAAGLAAKWENRREILGVAAVVTITLLGLRAHDQASCWRDSIALWSNTVESTGPNSTAQNNLGNALLNAGRVDDALVHLEKAVEIEPGLADAHLSLGNALLQKGRGDEAIAEFKRALDIKPDFVKAHTNLGVALQQTGRVDEAIAQYQRALEIDDDLPQAHNNLGVALESEGRFDEAITHFQKAVELLPGYQAASDNLARTLKEKEAKGRVP